MSEIVLDAVSTPFEVYADATEADNYLAGAMSSDAWFASSEETKKKALITATRIFDRQCWSGSKTDTNQVLEWPRSDTGINGVVDDEIPQDITYGAIELANQLVAGSTVETNPTPGAQQLEVIKAGSVLLQYFRGAESLMLQQSRFPIPVQELVGRYMCGDSPTLGLASSYGTTSSSGEESVTADYPGFNEGT